jgi:hypothetical protein
MWHLEHKFRNCKVLCIYKYKRSFKIHQKHHACNEKQSYLLVHAYMIAYFENGLWVEKRFKKMYLDG